MLTAILYLGTIVVLLCLSGLIYKFLLYLHKNPFTQSTLADFVPSQSLFKDRFVLNKDGCYSAVIMLDGFAYHKENDLTLASRNNILIRERALNFANLQADIQIKFIFSRVKGADGLFQNIYAIELTGLKPPQIEEVISSLLSGLSSFQPRLLTAAALVEFIFFNINRCQQTMSKTALEALISDVCSYSNLSFEKDYGVLENVSTSRLFKCLSLSFGSEIDERYFNQLLTMSLDFDFVINSLFFTKTNAQTLISTDKKNISASNDPDKSAGVGGGFFNSSNKKLEEVAEVQEILDNEAANLAVFDAFMIIYADNPPALRQSIEKIKHVTSKFEIYLTEEVRLLNFFFFQKLIGFRWNKNLKFLAPHSDVMTYAKKILSSTIAGIIDYIDTPKGLESCDWGAAPAVTLSTHYNNAYKLYLHVSETKAAVAHGVVVAPTGGGKTTFVQFLEQGILANYPDVDIYAFDRFNGMSIFTNWQGGQDVDFGGLAINPLQVDLEDEDGVIFLETFLGMLAKPETPEDKQLLSNFINQLKFVAIEERILNNVFPILPHSTIKDNLLIWAEGKYASYINAPVDSLNLSSDRFFNFQMDRILDDEELSAPIIYYLLYKIRQKARTTARGHFVFIDETAKMVKNPYFVSQIEVLLQEHRKLRGAVWLAFQNPNAFLSDKKLKELILNQCQNIMLFGSDAINDETLEQLNIGKSIFNQLQTTKKDNRNPYFVLLKRPSENVILNTNLTDILGDDLKFLSSSVEDVNRMRTLIDAGEDWIEKF